MEESREMLCDLSEGCWDNQCEQTQCCWNINKSEYSNCFLLYKYFIESESKINKISHVLGLRMAEIEEIEKQSLAKIKDKFQI